MALKLVTPQCDSWATLERLRGLGVKTANFQDTGALLFVEFFPEFVQVPEGANPNAETLAPPPGDVPAGHRRAFDRLTGKRKGDDDVSED